MASNGRYAKTTGKGAGKPGTKPGSRTGAGAGSRTGAGAGSRTGTGAGAGAGSRTGTGAGATGAEATGAGYSFIDPTAASFRPDEPDLPGADGTGTAGATQTDEPKQERRGGWRPGAGRKAGSTNSTTNTGTPKSKEKIQASLEGIEGLLLSLHLMAATFLKIQELALTEDEARRLAKATQRVAELYDIEATEKTVAWVNLITCAGAIYGTRMFAFTMRVRGEKEAETRKKQSPPPQTDNVYHPFVNNTAAV